MRAHACALVEGLRCARAHAFEYASARVSDCACAGMCVREGLRVCVRWRVRTHVRRVYLRARV